MQNEIYQLCDTFRKHFRDCERMRSKAPWKNKVHITNIISREITMITQLLLNAILGNVSEDAPVKRVARAIEELTIHLSSYGYGDKTQDLAAVVGLLELLVHHIKEYDTLSNLAGVARFSAYVKSVATVEAVPVQEAEAGAEEDEDSEELLCLDIERRMAACSAILDTQELHTITAIGSRLSPTQFIVSGYIDRTEFATDLTTLETCLAGYTVVTEPHHEAIELGSLPRRRHSCVYHAVGANYLDKVLYKRNLLNHTN